MKYGKRQLILASLVLALGAAVYLNWQFAGTGVQVEEESSAETSSALGAAQLVKCNYAYNHGGPDEAVEMLEDILNDAEADSAVKEAAVSEASAIAQNILKETNIESLVAAKGFSECVAYINDNTCTIVVNGDMEDAQNALIVRDIAAAETGFSADQIKIISAAA